MFEVPKSTRKAFQRYIARATMGSYIIQRVSWDDGVYVLDVRSKRAAEHICDYFNSYTDGKSTPHHLYNSDTRILGHLELEDLLPYVGKRICITVGINGDYYEFVVHGTLEEMIHNYEASIRRIFT